MKKYKPPFFKNGGLNDVIELKNKKKKYVLKSYSNESDECLAYQWYSHTCFQRILKILREKNKSNRNGGLEIAGA